MNFKNKLMPGQAVDIVIPEGQEYSGRYRTRIDEVGERVVSIGAPYIQGEVIPLREGTVIEVTFSDEISAYSFDAKIIQRIAIPIPVFVLELVNSIRRVQRRDYVRVPAFYDVLFRTVTRQGLGNPKKGNMQDLSGGGMRFQTKEALENKAILYMQLTLPNGEVQTPARVCRVEKIDDGRRYSISVEFYEINERDRDRIIRCVFDLQRAMRKKGLV